jgi:hypothetical protein
MIRSCAQRNRQNDLPPLYRELFQDEDGRWLSLCILPKYQRASSIISRDEFILTDHIYADCDQLLSSAFNIDDNLRHMSCAVYSNNGEVQISTNFEGCRVACLVLGDRVVTAATYIVNTHASYGRSNMVRSSAHTA